MNIGDMFSSTVAYVPTAARYVAGMCCYKAAYDITTGNKTSVVGQKVLSKETESKVTWQRTLVGVTMAGLGTALITNIFFSLRGGK